MGTNYFARYHQCPTCKRSSVEKHIGKSSCGWKFLFHAHHDISSWNDWKIELSQPGVIVFDEYGHEVSLEYLKELIESKQQHKEHSYPDHYGYIDSDGYDFCANEFL